MFMSFLLLSICAFILTLIAVPFWLYLNYKAKQSNTLGLSVEEKKQLQQLQQQSALLSQRVNQLEALLDYHQPHWRETHRT